MKRSRRDKILTTAFGDADALDLSGLTDEERAEYEDARRLSEGLKTLRDVPECQLSTERLIGAVLSSAARKRPTFTWGHAAVAAAVGVMAFFAMQSSLFNPGDSTNGKVVLNTGSVEGAPGVDGVTGPGIPLGENPIDTTTQPPVTLDAEKIDPPPPMVVEERDVVAEPPAAEDAGDLPAGAGGFAADIVPAPLSADESVKMTTVVLESTDPDPREPLVIVDSAYEDENGTFVAIEVETFGDVVFGG